MNYFIKILPILIWSCLHTYYTSSVFIQASPSTTVVPSAAATDENTNEVEVERYSTINKDTLVSQHPTKGLNKFRSRNKCYFSYCAEKKAQCSGLESCCWCECKPGYTFFSYEDGCLSAPKLNFLSEG